MKMTKVDVPTLESRMVTPTVGYWMEFIWNLLHHLVSHRTSSFSLLIGWLRSRHRHQPIRVRFDESLCKKNNNKNNNKKQKKKASPHDQGGCGVKCFPLLLLLLLLFLLFAFFFCSFSFISESTLPASSCATLTSQSSFCFERRPGLAPKRDPTCRGNTNAHTNQPTNQPANQPTSQPTRTSRDPTERHFPLFACFSFLLSSSSSSSSSSLLLLLLLLFSVFFLCF